MKKSARLSLKPDWDKIEDIRISGHKFLSVHGFDDDDKNAIIMILSELVENSIKYGIFKNSNSEITINININQNLITIEVNNPIDKIIENHIKRLDKTIQWIRGYQDSFEAYVENLKIVSRKPLDVVTSSNAR